MCMCVHMHLYFSKVTHVRIYAVQPFVIKYTIRVCNITDHLINLMSRKERKLNSTDEDMHCNCKTQSHTQHISCEEVTSP